MCVAFFSGAASVPTKCTFLRVSVTASRPTRMLAFSEASMSPPRSSALMVMVAMYGYWLLKRVYLETWVGIGARRVRQPSRLVSSVRLLSPHGTGQHR